MKFPNLTLLRACFTGLLACAAIAHAADRKPNFIFIIADDHRWDAMGAVQKEHGEKARYPWFESPAHGPPRRRWRALPQCLHHPLDLFARPRRFPHRPIHPRQRRHGQRHAVSGKIRHPRHPAARCRIPAPPTSASGTWATRRPAPRIPTLRQLHRPGYLSGLPVRDQRRDDPHQGLGR